MDIITITLYVVAALLLIGTGAAGYRYMLKRDPAKLEAWAKAIKEASARAQAKAREQ